MKYSNTFLVESLEQRTLFSASHDSIVRLDLSQYALRSNKHHAVAIFPLTHGIAKLSSGRIIGAVAGHKAIYPGGSLSVYMSILIDSVDVYDASTGRWSLAKLPNRTEYSTTITAGALALFVDANSQVDAYDSGTGQWSSHLLSQARGDFAAVSVGTKVLFAGGVGARGTGATSGASDTIDIFDTLTRQWSVGRLPVPASLPIVTTVGNKAVFVLNNNMLSIYDAATGQWSFRALPSSLDGDRSDTAVTIGNIAMFFNGNTGHAHFYDVSTGQWSVKSAPDAEYGMPIVVGTKAYARAIGSSSRDALAIYDSITRTWTKVLAPARLGNSTTSVGTKILFSGGDAKAQDVLSNNVLIYDTINGRWSSSPFSEPRRFSVALTLGTKAIFAGGKPLPYSVSDAVDTYTDTTPSPVISANTITRNVDTLSLSLKNSGDAPFIAPYTVRVYLSRSDTLRHAVLLGSQTIQSPLAPGDSLSLNIPINPPAANIPKSYIHLIEAVVDSTGRVTPIAVTNA